MEWRESSLIIPIAARPPREKSVSLKETTWASSAGLFLQTKISVRDCPALHRGGLPTTRPRIRPAQSGSPVCRGRGHDEKTALHARSTPLRKRRTPLPWQSRTRSQRPQISRRSPDSGHFSANQLVNVPASPPAETDKARQGPQRAGAVYASLEERGDLTQSGLPEGSAAFPWGLAAASPPTSVLFAVPAPPVLRLAPARCFISRT